MMTPQERNKEILKRFRALIKEAKKRKDIKFPAPFIEEELELLFSSHIWGHREITLTIILATLLEPSFRASKNFYDCNPRAIYENPIRTILREEGIPHKKSGPLNVAKNTQKINKDWAENKRGDGLALIVADLVKKIENIPQKTLYEFATAFVYRYLQEAKKITKLKFKGKKVENPVFLYQLARELILEVPDGGSTPQIIVGLLLEASLLDEKSKNSIIGHKDSVSTTNTTSKKPGDIIEILPGNKHRVYEITVKVFNPDRMLESFESIKDFDEKHNIKEVYVLCRKQDTPENLITLQNANFFLGTSIHQDLIYYFVDIFEWIQEKILFMSGQGRSNYYANLVDYVNEINTSEKVKNFFKQWHKNSHH